VITVETYASEDALAVKLASRLVDAVARSPRLVLGLPTGRTSVPLYRALRDRARRADVDWSGVYTFNLDEFVGLGRADPGSYRAFMQAELFDDIPIEAAHVDMLDGRASDLERECRRYEHAIRALGGIDIQLLGIGANGHIGFNEPGEGLRARTHIAVLHPQTRAANASLFGSDPARVPERALSMGMGTILEARQIVLVATGGEKAAAVAGTVRGPVTTRLPASFLQLHPHVTLMLDRGAAAEL
jgi:glucosamine-6-phosphate deaminase